jgi:RNA polymerase sigma-70 factor (ECF subfamily)
MPLQTSASGRSARPEPVWLDRRFGQALRRRAFALTRQQAAADDLVQDTYERALRLPITDPANERVVMAWLQRIVYNRFIDEKRRARGRTCVAWDEVTVDAAPANDVGEAVPRWRVVSDEDLQALLERLPPIYRDVLLRQQRGQTTQTMAEELGVDYKTVESRLFRARVQLRAMAGGGGQPPSPARRSTTR